MNITPQYIAGFIDGEGYFGIIKKSDKKLAAGYYYVPVLKISQVTENAAVLDAIQKFIGYGLFYRKQNLTSKNSRVATSLEFRGMKRVFPIVHKLYPYLIVKKKQAEILLEYEKLPIYNGMSINPEIGYDELDRKRGELYKRMKVYNKRGLAETKR